MVPPALPEVEQPVPERNLDELKGKRHEPRDLGVSNDHHFEPPATEMGDEVDIEYSIVDIKVVRDRVLRRVNSAVIGIGLLRKLISITWMENFKGFPGNIPWQK